MGEELEKLARTYTDSITGHLQTETFRIKPVTLLNPCAAELPKPCAALTVSSTVLRRPQIRRVP